MVQFLFCVMANKRNNEDECLFIVVLNILKHLQYLHLEHVTLNFYHRKCIASTGKCSFIETLFYFVTRMKVYCPGLCPIV